MGATARMSGIASSAPTIAARAMVKTGKSYSLSAACLGPVVLLRIDRQRMKAILARDHEIAARFFKHLAGALGNRLLQLYPRVTYPLGSGDS